jgi:hypothetical protein
MISHACNALVVHCLLSLCVTIISMGFTLMGAAFSTNQEYMKYFYVYIVISMVKPGFTKMHSFWAVPIKV